MEGEGHIGRWKNIVFVGKSTHPILGYGRLKFRKGCFHEQLRLHYLATFGFQGSVYRDLRLIPWMEVLSSARQICTADAGIVAVSHIGRKMGLGSRAARPIAQPRLAKVRDERSAKANYICKVVIRMLEDRRQQRRRMVCHKQQLEPGRCQRRCVMLNAGVDGGRGEEHV